MQITARDVERIPRGNLRVPRVEFVAVWVEAERLGDDDWFAAGVARTCRWIATVATIEVNGRAFPLRSPVTRRQGSAYEELIAEEYVAAEVLQFRRPRPEWLRGRGGWIDGVAGTLRWAWGRRGTAPLHVAAAVDG